MRLLVFLIILFNSLLISTAWASDGALGEPLLNKVMLRFSAEQYVTTKSALVTVGVNAGVNEAGLETIQNDVLKKLNDLSNKGEWHIIAFDRSQDQSGLEKVQISAQARLASSDLPGLRAKAKTMSKPGETYTLDNVEFTPSEAELRDANTALRGQIYAQAQDEIDRLNKLSSNQKYYMHQVDFLSNIIVPGMMRPVNMMALRANGNDSSNNNLAVGDKLTISATVVLAALPDDSLLKAIHN